jgi:hypothetical protein
LRWRQDIEGNPRIQNGGLDMGVHEGASTTTNSATPDFAIGAMPTNLSISAGQSRTATVTMTPVGGLVGTITFTARNCQPM